MKKTTAYARKLKRQQANATKQKAKTDYDSQLLTIRLKIMLLEDGDDATEVLAALSVVIGTPCEAAARMGLRDPWVRQLHGALKTVHSLCMDGYTWRTEFAQALDRASEIADDHRDQLDTACFSLAWVEAVSMAERILNHSVEQGDIA